jgi:hypothetical protein
MARRLGIPVRTWYNYEGGVTVPAEVVLRIIELTSVEPMWLLHGRGPKFRDARAERRDGVPKPTRTVSALLRTALQLLDNDDSAGSWPHHNAASGNSPALARAERLDGDEISFLSHVPGVLDPPASHRNERPGSIASGDGVDGKPEADSHQFQQAEWLQAQQDNRCLQVHGDAMAPIVADGASVAYLAHDEDPLLLDGKLVVVWIENTPIVRWFQHCGRYALLRAENANTVPQQMLIDLDDPSEKPRFRRVLWINTPH